MEHDDLTRELDLAELRRRSAEADRHEREAEAVRTRLWLEAMKWAVAGAGVVVAVLRWFGGG